MQTQQSQQSQTAERPPVQPTGCCPPFDPATWDGREVTWKDKPFVTDHVHSLFHVPLDLGRKVVRNQKLIEAAKARPEQGLMLSDEASPWSSEIYIDVTHPVPGARMATLSGTFLAKVFEGPYRDAPRWCEQMRAHVAGRGRNLEKIYSAYTTCPRCAKAYGKNYVVLFAKVAEAVAGAA